MVAKADETQSTLVVGYYSLPPHAMFVDGAASGMTVSYLEDVIFPVSKYQLRWEFYPFARVLKELKRGAIDAGILIARTKQRSDSFRFPEVHLYETQSGLVVQRESHLSKIQNLTQLKGLVLGHVTNSVRPEKLVQAGVLFEDLSGEDAFARNITKLKRKRIDGIYVPTLSHGRHQLAMLPDIEGLKVLELPLEGYKLYTVFRKDIDQTIIDEYERKIDPEHYRQYLK